MDRTDLVRRFGDRLREGGAEAVSELIVEELWLAVVEGSIETGERLPTSRQLGIALGVSPRSIERAYAELQRRGVVAARQGAGTFISLTRPSEQDLERHRQLAQLCRETLNRATELGFALDDVQDVLAELRSADADSSTQEHVP